MGGDWQQRNVSTGDVGTNGPAKGHESLRVGIKFGETDDDQVRTFFYVQTINVLFIRRKFNLLFSHLSTNNSIFLQGTAYPTFENS